MHEGDGVASTYTWEIPAPVGGLAIHSITKSHALFDPLVAAVLLRRGIIGDDLVHFLHPDLADLLPASRLGNMEPATRVLDEAIRVGRRICVYGDYDVDGTSGAALLVSYLRSRNADVDCFIPFRNEGYGLSKASLDRIVADKMPEILLTVDCGTSSRAEIAYARSLGMEVLVTDHHRPTPGNESEGIVVNPHRDGDTYPNKSLAGVGVAYKLVSSHFGRAPVVNLDLVALGTIADVMSLTGENRILVRAGLERLAHTRRPGLAALIETCVKINPCPHGLGGSCRAPSAEDVAFQIGPRINAIGRMGLDPMLVTELFLTADESRAHEIATLLDTTNKERRTKTNALVDTAIARIAASGADDPVIVMQMDLFLGVAGLVAGRLASEFGRPAIVVDAEGQGSARSIEGIDLLSILQSRHSDLVRAAGHGMAMGIRDLADPDALRVALAADEWPSGMATRSLVIDAVCLLRDLDTPLLTALARLEPTGAGNPAPVFAVGGVTVREAKKMGDAGRHARMRLVDDTGFSRTAVWFGGGDRLPSDGARVDVAGRAVADRAPGGSARIEIHVVDIRSSAEMIPLTIRG